MKLLIDFLKRKMVILLVAVVIVFLVLFNAGFFGGKDERVRVSCVGDSLTYGSGVLKTRDLDSYPAKLQARLGTSHIVSNFGLRNATASTTGDLPYVDSEEYAASLKSNPDIVVIMLGTNDSKTYNWNPDKYEHDLTVLINSYSKLDSSPLIYIMRCPYCYSLDGGNIAEYDIQPAVVRDEIGPILERIEANTGACLIDLYTPTEGKEELYTDGIHFNAEGYELISDIVYDWIK